MPAGAKHFDKKSNGDKSSDKAKHAENSTDANRTGNSTKPKHERDDNSTERNHTGNSTKPKHEGNETHDKNSTSNKTDKKGARSDTNNTKGRKLNARHGEHHSAWNTVDQTWNTGYLLHGGKIVMSASEMSKEDAIASLTVWWDSLTAE